MYFCVIVYKNIIPDYEIKKKASYKARITRFIIPFRFDFLLPFNGTSPVRS